MMAILFTVDKQVKYDMVYELIESDIVVDIEIIVCIVKYDGYHIYYG
jgi:hypothetical protein